MNITAIRTPATRMALVRDDEKALYTAGEIFKPAAINDLKRFSCLRNLNMVHPVEPSTNVRHPETYISYYVSPLSIMAKLAIKTGVPLWHQLHYAITDAEFLADLTILADLKSRGLLRAVEYGNEVWNQGTFQDQYAYVSALAAANPACTNNVDNTYLYATWQAGYRSAQLGKLARENGTQVPFAIGPQPVQPNLWYAVKLGRDAAGGVPSDCPLLMSTAYCSGVMNVGVEGVLGAALDAWVAGSDFDALLDNALNFPGSAPTWGQYTQSIVKMGEVLLQAKAIADQEGMELVLYEGNGHFNAAPFARNIDTYKIAFYNMYKSLLMKIAARQILETAQAAGVTLFNWFDWNSEATRYENGYFGTKNLPAYDALLAWQASLPEDTGTPVFTTNPSISPASGSIGTTFTANDGVAN